MTGFLASVASLDEMEVVRRFGADIVDLKDPSRGALGAWETSALEAAVERWRSWGSDRPALSATIGDQPMEPDVVRAAAARAAAAGVSLVKVGLFPNGDPCACIRALGSLESQGVQVIVVFFGDLGIDLGLLGEAATAGLQGAMIDTADKTAGSLRSHLDDAQLARFVARAKAHSLLTGLAGSLRLQDVAPLAAIGPDYLGFRGALCAGGRSGRLNADAVAQVANLVKAQGVRGTSRSKRASAPSVST